MYKKLLACGMALLMCGCSAKAAGNDQVLTVGLSSEMNGTFSYIKILVSEQGNAVCEKLSNCHNLLIMRNDKKGYRNSQHFAFAF